MAILKCKMCAGDLNVFEGMSTVECEYCGTLQTIPVLDDEKKLIQFERAERLRKQCEFDKAAGIYETIVADFRQEAEAYWGLVLCKYGIEYVDDPATGKKIPTCHRSSFDSIMDDSDFEQALENADPLARRVYREQAKQIEQIRKGIIEVSSNEQPYDIFICYKETDEKGQRTLDSVLAQDIYDALTGHGYRTFFARITLEDKLGQEYEPYIFAALNSAKIMLAVGTDYEYYNAVWVKNEWSRFLKLMAKDKSKHLIPCFKGIDAYDMPREFNRLQAQDLGKMGAIQDILRGVEKLLPKAAPVPVVQEAVVVGGGGSNKIASLLDRGNMALEDGDWAKADSFFEDVLNNDSKNAQAYLGKTLAQERCRTIDAFVRKRKDAYQNVRGQTLKLEPDNAHVEEAVSKYSIPGYVEAQKIRALYPFDLSYHSDVAERRKQYKDEEAYWAAHKLLSRAEKFAAGPVAENFQREKKALFAALSDRVKKAEAEEAAAKKELLERYGAHLKKADDVAARFYEDGEARRNSFYQTLAKTAKESTNVAELTNTAKKLDQLGGYRDCKSLAARCRKRADEEQAKQDAKRAKEQSAIKAKNTRLAIIMAAAVCIIITASVAFFFYTHNRDYNEALALKKSGRYSEAFAAFEALDGYKDSEEQINLIRAELITRDTISAGGSHTVGLKPDGTVVATGYTPGGRCAVESWTDIVAISAGSANTVGLRADGTVVAVGSNAFHQCNIENWTNIIEIRVGNTHTVGLKNDGTVVAMGANTSGKCKVENWIDIIAIDAGFNHTVGLKSDGTVVAVGDNGDSRCEVDDWTDIVAISAGTAHTVGLKSDGTVIAVGYNNCNQCEVDGWTDIVAISAGSAHTVGLKVDGTVVAAGSNNSHQCKVESWTDIVAISAGDRYTVGLKSDGTVVAVGDNSDGQCYAKNWTNIKLP